MKEQDHEFLGVVFVKSKKSLALSVLIAALGVTSLLNCSASDNDISYATYRDIALEIFMDSFGKTLVMGYVPPEDLNTLPSWKMTIISTKMIQACFMLQQNLWQRLMGITVL